MNTETPKSSLTTGYTKQGFLYGLLGTLAMSIIMLIGVGTGLSPMPAPIPMAIVKGILGNIAKPLLVGLTIIAHFGYGATAGVIFGYLFKEKSSIRYGLGWGVFLWLIMDLIVLPLLGWGVFGIAITPKIAVATLVLHLIYGGTLGWGMSRITSN